MHPVILSGGSGSRLWPLSREAYPKQLIALTGERTLLQDTARRLDAVDGARRPIVVCNERHRFMVAEQLRDVEITPAAILLEPVARNTAPAIACAALEALSQNDRDDDPLLLVMPTDHVIQDAEKFARAVQAAAREATRGRLVTFGATPDHPETGYGYIQAGSPTDASGEARIVERFVEKPAVDEAARLIDAGDCYWNCGMFVFAASRYLAELERHAPGVLEAAREAYERKAPDLEFSRLDAESFGRSPSISVDYAVMEHAADVAVAPLGTDWSDVGSWTALADLSGPDERDENGNVTRGDVALLDARDVYARSESRLVTALGVEDLVIVDTPDALLVAGKDAAQDAKRLVERLKRADREECLHHRKVYRPWGHYDSVHEGDRFKVKHIIVNPGQRLSLQAHRHRAEHWVVVRGVARVTRGDETFTLSENESTFIPRGARHRLENPGEEPLELIEVQSGSYLGEDDISRFEDAYGRSGSSSPDP